MIMDKTQQFCSAQAVTNGTILTNVIDLGSPGTALGGPAALSRDIGPGQPIPLMIQVTTAFAGIGTVVFNVTTSDSPSLTGGTTTIVASTPAYVMSPLILGYQIPLSILPNQITGRYLGIAPVVNTTSLTGSVTAAIVSSLQTNKAAGRA